MICSSKYFVNFQAKRAASVKLTALKTKRPNYKTLINAQDKTKPDVAAAIARPAVDEPKRNPTVIRIGVPTAAGDYIFSILANKTNGKTRTAINDIAKAIIDAE